MVDEFPVGELEEKRLRLKCLGAKVEEVTVLDLSDGGLTFGDVGEAWQGDAALRTLRERHEIARLEAMLKPREGKKAVHLSKSAKARMRVKKMRRRLEKKVRKEDMAAFHEEVGARVKEGYSVRQLMRSHIPDIGKIVQVTTKEVNEALARKARRY